MTSATAFKNALEYFPKWMNIRRRPYTSNAGSLLEAILSEFDYIEEALEDYRKDFFLVNYIGREEEILSILYLAHIGTVDSIEDITVQNEAYQNFIVTDDITEFQENVESIYYQDGYLFIRQQYVTDTDPSVQYVYNDYVYSIKWSKFQVWNIFDEFAWFAGLERFEDETNTELSNRVRKAFANRTNVTRQGLSNAVTNAILQSSANDITFEQPNEENMALPDDEYGTVFEKMSQFNKDLARTKVWDTTYWENAFKQTKYIPHVWDAPVSIYQDGVGYNDSCLVQLTDDLQAESTTVTVTGYRKSLQSIHQYIENNTITKELSLQLEKYKNILDPVLVQYKITATSVEEIDPSSITIASYQTMAGRNTYVLEDIVEETQNITKTDRGQIEANTNYKLTFTKSEPVGTMEISKCDLIVGDNVTSLLKEQGQFVFVGDSIYNSDVKYYTDSIKNLSTYTNMKDAETGFTIDDITKEASFMIDASDLKGQYISYDISCPMSNIASNNTFITSDGFTLANNEWTDTSSSTQHTLTIKLLCSAITFSLAESDNPITQGTIQFSVFVNGEQDGPIVTQWSRANTYTKTFSTLSEVEIVIQKNGQYPVTITDIQASRYEFEITTDTGKLLQTPFGYLVPSNADTIFGTLRTYDTQSPQINYIYCGPNLQNATYTIDGIYSEEAASISIRTNCDVTLTNMDTGEVTKPFETSALYTNNSDDNGIIYVDLSQFTTIISSDPEIYTESVKGVIRNYIVVKQGESVDTITVIGESSKLLQTVRLRSLLPSYNHAYGCTAVYGIILDTNTGQELFHVTRDLFPSAADTFTVTNADLHTIFVQDADRNVQIVTTSLTGEFEELYWCPASSSEYIAYNTYSMLQQEVHYVSMVFSFSPVLQPSALVLYQLDDVVSDKYAATVMFEKTKDNTVVQENWSLGIPDQGICITLDMDISNTEQYQIEVISLTWPFVIKNTIPLESTYPVNGETIELAQYIIIPPEGMEVNYSTNTVRETFYAEEDGFNKLTYSNIISITSVYADGVLVSSGDYNLLQEPGILVWNTTDHTGESIQITYSYKNPVSLSFTSLDAMYDYVEVTVDAYEAINDEPLVYTDVKAGDVINLPFTDADRLSVRCSNDGFTVQANADKTQLTVLELSSDNRVAVHCGYYYDAGKEYWKFANEYIEVGDHYDGVTMERVDKVNDTFVLSQASTNHVTNSLFMDSGQFDIYCIADFVKNHQIPAISNLRYDITACDSYNGWYRSPNMTVSFVEYEHRMALSFTDKGDGFAILDISPYIFDSAHIYCDADDSISVYIARDIDLDNELYTRKTIYAELVKQLDNHNGYVDTYDKKRCQFLVVTGTGVLRELIIKKDEDGDNAATIHERNIDKFNFDITESRSENSEMRLAFDSAFSRVKDTEFDRINTLFVGTNVDYGLTLLKQSDFSKCDITGISYANDIFTTGEESGTIVTETLELESKDNIGVLHVVVNQLLLSSTYQGFTIELLTASSASGPYSSVLKKEGVTELTANRRYLNTYVKARITMPKNKRIDTIAIFGEYDTQNSNPHIHYHSDGTMTSKVFDAVTAANYQLTHIDYSAYNPTVVLYIRACRQNDTETVWTDWTHIELDDSGNVTNEIIYRNYRMFQLQAHLIGEDASIRIEAIRMKAVE